MSVDFWRILESQSRNLSVCQFWSRNHVTSVWPILESQSRNLLIRSSQLPDPKRQGTPHSSPSTQILAPGTQHSTPSTQLQTSSSKHSAQCSAPGRKHPAFSTQRPVFSTQNPAASTQSQAPCTHHPVLSPERISRGLIIPSRRGAWRGLLRG